MARRMSIRTVACGLALVVVIAGAGTSQARRYAGIHVKGHTFRTGPHAADVQLRLVCPPQTQATPRSGDFSFCRGKMVITRKGVVVARGPFSIRTFDSHLEHFPTTRAGRRTFKPGRRMTVHWRARSHDGRGRYATRSGNVQVIR
jgi:hypothetical protein